MICAIAAPLTALFAAVVLVDVFGGFTLPFRYYDMRHDCNEVAYGNITRVVAQDPFMCDVVVRVDDAWSATIRGLLCSVVRPCIENLTSCGRVLVAFNHFQIDGASPPCINLVSSKDAMPLSSYADSVASVRIILGCWAITLGCVALVVVALACDAIRTRLRSGKYRALDTEIV